jgi:hypothetical protein
VGEHGQASTVGDDPVAQLASHGTVVRRADLWARRWTAASFMPRIPLSQAVPGQKLARPVTNASGMVMMQAGTELTATILDRLVSIGVEFVAVVDDAATRPVRDEVQRVLDERFTGHEQDPWMMELKAIVLRQALRGGDDA